MTKFHYRARIWKHRKSIFFLHKISFNEIANAVAEDVDDVAGGCSAWPKMDLAIAADP
jgi:hypothetical protein